MKTYLSCADGSIYSDKKEILCGMEHHLFVDIVSLMYGFHMFFQTLAEIEGWANVPLHLVVK